MKQNVKAKYEAPVTEVWEMSLKNNLLQVSGQEVEATREGYVTATYQNWE
ncbi:MAG: hypothetical protein J6P46_07935 [Bacteroidales bacterium]|nr:hypothetical protein [Bacteroidales bacterium]